MKNILRRLRFSAILALFVIMLSLTLIVFALENFTKEEVLSEYLTDYSLTQVGDVENLKEMYDQHKPNCETGALDQNVAFRDGNKTIDCNKVLTATRDSYPRVLIKEFVFKEAYEKKFPCTFLQCLTNKETMTILLSREGHYFLNNIKTFLIIGTIIIALLVAVLSETIPIGLKSIGMPLFLVGGGYTLSYFYPLSQLLVKDATIDAIKTSQTLLQPVLITSIIIGIVGLVMVIVGIITRLKNRKIE